jgi:hypothetical protein
MKKFMKNLWENYKTPTPDKFRKLGDWLLLIAGIGGIVLSQLTLVPAWVGSIISLIGIIGKILSNFTSATTVKDVLTIIDRLGYNPKEVKK